MGCWFTRLLMKRPFRFCSSVSALILLCASTASAQAIGGVVFAGPNKKPIANLEVQLLNAKNEKVKVGRTNAAGVFNLRMRSGSYYVGVDRIGFHSYRSNLLSVTGDSLLILRIELRDSVIALDEVTAAAQPRVRRLEIAGLYDRQKEGTGTFLMRDEIEKRNASKISQLLQGIAGMRLLPTRSTAVYSELVMRGGSRGGRNSYCYPRLYLDGALVRIGGTGAPMPRLDEVADPDDIEALEIYKSPAQVPSEFGGSNSSCGVVLIWTRAT